MQHYRIVSAVVRRDLGVFSFDHEPDEHELEHIRDELAVNQILSLGETLLEIRLDEAELKKEKE